MAYIDQFSAESLLVIKKPPSESPTINLINTIGESTFLEDRFVCFAYRYQYANGEFSAVSQFSDPAFAAASFGFTPVSFLNEGMINDFNAVEVTVNTGDSLVMGFEILFKEMQDPTIKIIERVDKLAQGVGNNDDFTLVFDGSKIFTVLPENEILRLYDNVPLKAQAQTIMGNRLVYGNYIEGYDLKDRFNNAVNFNYSATLDQAEVELIDVPSTIGQGYYTYGATQSVDNSILTIDLTGIALNKGSRISFEIAFIHSSFSTTAGVAPTSTTPFTQLSFNYILQQDFSDAYTLATSADFVAKIGSSTSIQTVTNSCNGFTFTDEFNCVISNLGSFVKTESGISAGAEGFQIYAYPTENTIGLQLLAMKFVDSANTTYEYYRLSSADVQYTGTSNNYSLHSNRGYEIGIIYMDDFNRSSTALVSPNNTVSVPCSGSEFINKIQVNIPGGQAGGAPAMIAPFWAKRFKFCIKPDRDLYETIYTNIFFQANDTNDAFFLLEGENANKVQAGDRLIVKSDANGVRTNCTIATVLEKETKTKGFITFPDPLNPSSDLDAPSGTYMKINPNNFSVVNNTDAGGNFVFKGTESNSVNKTNHFPKIFYSVSVPNSAGSGATSFIDYTIPTGSRVKITINMNRSGGGASAACQNLRWEFEEEVFVAVDYTNFKEFFDGENISALIQDKSTFTQGRSGSTTTYNGTIVYSQSGSSATSISTAKPVSSDLSQQHLNYYFEFFKSDTGGNATGETFLGISGDRRCAGRGRSSLEVNIEVIRADNTIVFETQPLDALPDVWYENDLSFSIDALGQHSGSSQDQIIDFQNAGLNTAQDAIIDTGFYNCITFGNGVESFKIRDSVNGKTLNFGNRTFTTSSQIYKQAHRFADLTYSGVFNDESNVNKLNEFNLGLANFKTLEDSFGPVRKLHARRNDILTLQEDRISYVLVGKDILTDAGGGGALTSVPTVLGKQIARPEEYGISNNPESFASWGVDTFFTDSKRGSVVKITGADVGNDRLSIISKAGMRSWFRDMFINSISTQKLGGYDPYTDEFVLATNSENTFEFNECIPCDTTQFIAVNPGVATVFCVDEGLETGTVTVSYIIPESESDNIISEENTPSGAGLVNVITETADVEIVTEATSTAGSGPGYVINAFYNGVVYTSGIVYISGSFTVPKSIADIKEITIEVSTVSQVSDNIEITVSCPAQTDITLYNIAITSNSDATKLIHNQYRWTDNVSSSPLQSNQVVFQSSTTNPIVSQYLTVNGALGSNAIPDEGALVSIISNKINNDNYDFDTVSNRLMYLRSSTVYSNTSTDINALLAAANNATPIVTDNDRNYATFTMPSGTSTDKHLYLIWDYRNTTSMSLCQDTTSAVNACCNCSAPSPVVPCGAVASYSGGQSYPDTQTITLGAGTGTVTLQFEAIDIPDRFIVEFDGSIVIDTQYRGDGTKIPQLNQTLVSDNLTEPNNGVYTGHTYIGASTGAADAPLPSTGDGTFFVGGKGTVSFTKSTATTTATLKVYGPLAGTKWRATLKCAT